MTEERAAIGRGLVAVGGFTRPIGEPEERAAIESELAAVGGFTMQADKGESSHWVRTGSSKGGGVWNASGPWSEIIMKITIIRILVSIVSR